MTKEFRVLQLIEQEFIIIFTKYIREWKIGKRAIKEAVLTGSGRQGSFPSSLFNPLCREKDEKICRELDLDIQFTHKEDLKEPTCLEDVKGKLGE